MIPWVCRFPADNRFIKRPPYPCSSELNVLSIHILIGGRGSVLFQKCGNHIPGWVSGNLGLNWELIPSAILSALFDCTRGISQVRSGNVYPGRVDEYAASRQIPRTPDGAERSIGRKEPSNMGDAGKYPWPAIRLVSLPPKGRILGLTRLQEVVIAGRQAPALCCQLRPGDETQHPLPSGHPPPPPTLPRTLSLWRRIPLSDLFPPGPVRPHSLHFNQSRSIFKLQQPLVSTPSPLLCLLLVLTSPAHPLLSPPWATVVTPHFAPYLFSFDSII